MRRRQPYLHAVYDLNQRYGDSLYRDVVDDLYRREGILPPRVRLATRNKFDDTYFYNRYARAPSLYRLSKRHDRSEGLRRSVSWSDLDSSKWFDEYAHDVMSSPLHGPKRFGPQNKIHVHSFHDRHRRLIDDHRALMAELQRQEDEALFSREHNRKWFHPDLIKRDLPASASAPLVDVYRRRRPLSSIYDLDYGFGYGPGLGWWW
ncbi:uncharacterized protein LOC135379014 [Ornithodoros turicata]|uniref:uncharacterized protein LOC135379014 n=1 Tax=Ornithodoros turicata TaxID=34597 RepID=UPI00313903A3